MNEQRKVVSEIIKENQHLNNSEIAKLLVEKFKQFKNSQTDSLRRYVSKIRKKEKLVQSTPLTINPDSPFTFKQEGKTAQAQGISDVRVQSLEDLVAFFKIDLNIWKVKKWECSVYESHTKMRHYDQEQQAKAGYFRIDDTHKVVPLYRVWALLEENRPLILLNDIKSEMMAELKAFAPKYPKISYSKDKDKKYLFELDIFDLHFGKLTWDEETGDNYDIKIARELFMTCLNQLIEQAKNYPVERIVFPIGNDFFNVDNIAETTVHNTPQDEDTRWKKTFVRGRQLIIEAIDTLRTIAPVDVLVIPGNHDFTRSFYLGDAVECWYHKCPDITVNNGAKVRKYYRYGKCLIGYTHGSEEKFQELPYIMANEEPQLWAETAYREWHLGDKHHRREIKWVSTEEYKGATVRFMRSLTSTDAWHYGKGYISSLRAGEGFIWDKNNGLVCEFSANL